MSSDHFLEYFSCDCAQGIPSVCTIDGSKALVYCKSAARQLVHCLMELGTNLFVFGESNSKICFSRCFAVWNFEIVSGG